MQKIGILITNTGTPDSPTPSAVRRYLREFLLDARVVQLPRVIWLPILYGLILPLRPKRSAKLYQAIWTDQGSPMRVFMQSLITDLQVSLGNQVIIEIGMNYGRPSIKEALHHIQAQKVERIIVLPLFPQYSHTTTASSFDRVKAALQTATTAPPIQWIKHYANHPAYITALANSVKKHWACYGQSDQLLISFHGIPERFVAAGDPYQTQCQQTASLLAAALTLPSGQWTLCYQSQFGYDKWLKPSTQKLFQTLPHAGVKRVDVICPGFAVDCLETLEEIALKGRHLFLQAGGETLHYIPALNASAAQVALLQTLLLPTI
ncbi:MAG: ferrochelatase [Gammaproteobacteria bacterium RIFCSPHIGHO2_12_FULL_45_12]|nr:MAG: ferrochelatase [Gammaproteobacteria bacterium RIFCSPHIGHO2_12_FULL_45_12]